MKTSKSIFNKWLGRRVFTTDEKEFTNDINQHTKDHLEAVIGKLETEYDNMVMNIPINAIEETLRFIKAKIKKL